MFSIDDLARAKDGTTRWDGVRNYQARNFLRDEIAVGDGVLFYHSSAEPPAVAGTARVVRAGYPDPTQFDPRDGHFDRDSLRDDPRWYAVDIQFDSQVRARGDAARAARRARARGDGAAAPRQPAVGAAGDARRVEADPQDGRARMTGDQLTTHARHAPRRDPGLVAIRCAIAMEAFYGGVLGLPVLRRWQGEDGERSIWFDLHDGGFLAVERVAGGPPRDHDGWNTDAAGIHLVALAIERGARDAWEAHLTAAGQRLGTVHSHLRTRLSVPSGSDGDGDVACRR